MEGVIWLWPSEAAALAGLNPYKTAREAEDEVVSGTSRRRRQAAAPRCRQPGPAGRGKRCREGLELEVGGWTGRRDRHHGGAVARPRGGGWGRAAAGRPWARCRWRSGADGRGGGRAPVHDYVQIQCYLHMLDGPGACWRGPAAPRRPTSAGRIMRSRELVGGLRRGWRRPRGGARAPGG